MKLMRPNDFIGLYANQAPMSPLNFSPVKISSFRFSFLCSAKLVRNFSTAVFSHDTESQAFT